jgi:hypothetical protein
MVPGSSLARAFAQLDRRWSVRLGCSSELVCTPGFRVVERAGMDAPDWMGWCTSFFALFPRHTANSVSVATLPGFGAKVADAFDEQMSVGELELAFLDVARLFGREQTYIFDIVTIDSRDTVVVSPVPEGYVAQVYESGSPVARSWDGRLLRDDVDGPVFALFDECGQVAAWAGVKCVSPFARDIAVATRSDCRRQGLARVVAGQALASIAASGVTPFYSCRRDNVASARLAASLGLVPNQTGCPTLVDVTTSAAASATGLGDFFVGHNTKVITGMT